jgi:hypothetical protein
MVQQYLIALLTSDETSIYGSSFQRSLVKLPKLDDWFEGALAWPHPCIGLVVVFLAARSSSSKQMFLRLALFGFFTLLFFDMVYSITLGTLSIASIFENIVADFVGAIGAAAAAILILKVADYGFDSFDWSIWARRGIAGCLVLLGGTLTLCAIFYLTDFFYRPRPANIALMADTPSYGFIISETAKKSSRHLTPEMGQATAAFSLLSQVTQSSSVNWRATKHARIDWSSRGSLAAYNVEVSLFTGCGPTDSERKLPPKESSFTVSNVQNFSLWHDWGAWDTTITAEHGSGSTELNGTDSSFFEIERSADGKNVELQQFVTGNSQLKYSGGTDSLDLFMIAPPGKPDDAMSATPNLHFNIDGNEHIINLRGSSSIGSDEQLTCQPAPTRKAFEQQVMDIGSYGRLLGVRVIISPQLTSLTGSLPNNLITITGDQGWIRVKGVEPKTLDSLNSNRINMISISGNLKAEAVNGTDISPKEGDNFVAVGDHLRGSFASGFFKISGDAELLWINSNRANQTKWESLPIEYKVLALTVIGSIFILITGYLARLVKRAERFTWLEDGLPPSP